MIIPLKERAKQFLMENKYSVIPVGANKIPLVPWTEYQHRFPTIAEIDAWWEKFPQAQIGIVTGEISNLTVVDVEKGGDPSFLPQNTTISKTGGEGRHYFYYYAEGIKNSTRIRPLIDIRSEGGYIVAPYSTSEKGSYEFIQQVEELLPFPKEFFPQKTEISTSSGGPGNILTNDLSKSLISDFNGSAPGQRNSDMAKFIGRVLCKVHPAHWDTVGWAVVMEANKKNSPPLPQNELYTTFKSIKGIRVRGTPINAPLGAENASNSVSSEVPREKDGSDEVKLMSVVSAEQKINTEDVYPLEMPCFDEAILGGVCPGDLVVVSGQTSCGKTSVCQDWTISLLRGKKKAPVLWFSYEVLVSSLWKKFKTMGAKDDELVVIPAKNTSGNVSWVEEKIKEAKERFGVKVVVIDHLGFLLPKTAGVMGKSMSLNYSTYLTQIVRDIKTIALQEEIIIILPVHMRKTETIDIDAIKDSVGIGQEADLVFLIERERNKEENAKSYFNPFTRITLAKNRKTGMTVAAWFTMINERFAFDDRHRVEALLDNDFESMTGGKAKDGIKNF